MKKKLTTVEFRGTKEQEAKLIEIIDAHKDERGAMMPILQQAQEVYGYLPVEVMRFIAERTGKPLEEIFGIATFYSQFSLNPKGEYAGAVCLGTACYVKGSGGRSPRMAIMPLDVRSICAGKTNPPCARTSGTASSMESIVDVMRSVSSSPRTSSSTFM